LKTTITIAKTAAVLLTAFFAAQACADNKPAPVTTSDRPVQELSDTAKLLAGIEIPTGSKLSEFSKSRTYRSYQNEISKAWGRFQKPNLEKIKTWWKDRGFPARTGTVLYPFSGPDILNALAFYPDAEQYVMFGLEAPGIPPDATQMTQAQIIQGLNGLKKSLGTILHMNFFRTEGMAHDLGNKSFNSISGLIMFFLAIDGCAVLDAKQIVIDEKSNIANGMPGDEKITWQNPPKSRVPGVEISFRRGNGRVQQVRYYMLNVIDSALESSSPNFLPYLKSLAPCSSVLKSASYLMHNDSAKFTKIRTAILDVSRYLVQDDSGVPLRYLSAGQWMISYHGFYDRPIPLFANRAQADLRKAFKEKSSGTLPFSYGYDYRQGESNLISAERPEK
jgi:hypothetical protein